MKKDTLPMKYLNKISLFEIEHQLTILAKKVAYGNDSIVNSGPLYKSMRIKDNSIILKFSSVGYGIATDKKNDGFIVAGKNGNFVWAKTTVLSRNTVKIWVNKIAHPKVVRYAWSDNPAYANLENNDGLPASPFTTGKNELKHYNYEYKITQTLNY